jgi:hypothetical protein
MDWTALDTLADRLRWQLRCHAFDDVGAITLDHEHPLAAELAARVTLADIEYERASACFAGAEKELAPRRRALAVTACRLLELAGAGRTSAPVW